MRRAASALRPLLEPLDAQELVAEGLLGRAEATSAKRRTRESSAGLTRRTPDRRRAGPVRRATRRRRTRRRRAAPGGAPSGPPPPPLAVDCFGLEHATGIEACPDPTARVGAAQRMARLAKCTAARRTSGPNRLSSSSTRRSTLPRQAFVSRTPAARDVDPQARSFGAMAALPPSRRSRSLETSGRPDPIRVWGVFHSRASMYRPGVAALNHHHLLHFWTVVREGGVTRASEKLNVSQPTVSGQLRELQEALGEKLLVRSGTHARPHRRRPHRLSLRGPDLRPRPRAAAGREGACRAAGASGRRAWRWSCRSWSLTRSWSRRWGCRSRSSWTACTSGRSVSSPSWRSTRWTWSSRTRQPLPPSRCGRTATCSASVVSRSSGASAWLQSTGGASRPRSTRRAVPPAERGLGAAPFARGVVQARKASGRVSSAPSRTARSSTRSGRRVRDCSRCRRRSRPRCGGSTASGSSDA